MRLPLLGGSYVGRSIIANAQRCINYFPETNPKDSPVPVTYYQRPGLVPIARDATNVAPVRGIWRASNGNAYCVIGDGAYSLGAPPGWALTRLGSITVGRTNPCSFVDNGLGGSAEGLLVDGSSNGWIINISTNVFSQVVDPSGAFQGADKVDFIDSFVLFNVPGTYSWGSTHTNGLTFDPLYQANKTDWPDPLRSIAVNRHEILLIGDVKSEIWYDAGNPLFPFAELPGAFIEHGTASAYSVATSDISTFWLGQDLQGSGVVWRFRGYQTSRISNHALEVAIRRMRQSVGIGDAIAYTYQQDGHYFYVLSFPAGDQTWVFDESTNEWHQRAWTDADGVLHRDRTNCHAFIYGYNVVGDWENGQLYSMDLEAYSDTDADGTETPITCLRTFPHITKTIDPKTAQPLDWDGKRIRYTRFQLDLEPGMAPGPSLGDSPPLITLRYSDDRGRTWVASVLQSSGHPGEYLAAPTWQGLGVARNRVFEISHSLNGPAALNGAFIEGLEAEGARQT